MVEPHLLIDNLNRNGIHFLVDDGYSRSTVTLTPAELLAGLSVQSDARLRLALIALLLQRSDFAMHVHQALIVLDQTEQLTFKLYYTAAYYLQIIYADQLVDTLGSYEKLPDYFSEELKIERHDSASDQLLQLAERHKEFTGMPLNWYGAYDFAAQRVISRLNKEKEWITV